MQNSRSLPLLLTFAPELIQLINDNLDIEDTKALRLTHRHLASTLSTSVLHTLTVNIKTTSDNSNHHKLSLAKLALLASQSDSYHPAHRATRVLRILSLSSISDSGLSEGGPEETKNVKDPEPLNANLVIDAISSLKGLHEVYWDLNQQEGDTKWPHLTVLTQIPNLQKLHIKTSQCNIPLPHLPHTLPSLRSLSFDASLITCPDSGKAMFDNLARSIAILGPLGSLTSLSVSHNWKSGFRNESFHTLFKYYPPNAPPMRLSHLHLNGCFVSLDDDIVLPHLTYLTCLELTKIQYSYITRQPPPSPLIVTGSQYNRSDPGEIWREVQKAGIRLKEITIDCIPSSFLTYLSSYSGLRKLHVSPGGFNHVDSSDVIAQRFFGYPLTNHTRSLEDLEITARSEGRWCFGEHNVCVISKLTNLRNLRLGIISSRLWKKYDFKEGAAPIRNPHPDTIKLLLDTTTTYIPHLQTLRISPATPPDSRCGNASISCYSPIGRQIAYNARKYAVPPSCLRLPSLSVCLNKSGYFKEVGGTLRVGSLREGALGYDKMVITSEERRRYRI